MRLPVKLLVEKYRNHIFAASFNICKNAADADDIVQETFLKYFQNKEKDFASEEHIKAWMLRVAINRSKNVKMSFRRRGGVPWEEYMSELVFESEADRDVFEAVMQLPSKYRIITHLFYYEGYCIREIGALLGMKESAVKVRLMRARRLLKEKLKEEWNENE